MTSRTFTVPTSTREALTFTLEGVMRSDPEQTWSETFTVLPAIPADLLDELILSSHVRDGRIIVDQVSVQRLLLACIEPEEEDRMRALFSDKQRLVPITLLAEVMQWCITEVTGRPTTP